VTTTFRSDTRDGAYAMLVAFAVANPTFNLSVYRTQPKNFGSRPLAFVASLDEAINHTGTSLYQRAVTITFAFVWAPSADNVEVNDVRDDVVDAFLTYAIANVHAISNTTVTFSPQSTANVTDGEVPLDGAFYPGTSVTVPALALQGSL